MELALVVPVFIALLLGAAEFARLAYAGIEVSNAARAGVAYGSQSSTTAADISWNADGGDQRRSECYRTERDGNRVLGLLRLHCSVHAIFVAAHLHWYRQSRSQLCSGDDHRNGKSTDPCSRASDYIHTARAGNYEGAIAEELLEHTGDARDDKTIYRPDVRPLARECKLRAPDSETTRRARREAGGTLVEFALSATILLTLVFGVMAMCMALYIYHFVSDAAREGARYAMVRGSSCSTYGKFTSDCPLSTTAVQARFRRTYAASIFPE